jgi:hypothetical protein
MAQDRFQGQIGNGIRQIIKPQKQSEKKKERRIASRQVDSNQESEARVWVIRTDK